MAMEKQITNAFSNSRKLKGVVPNDQQVQNVITRLSQIFTDEELQNMEEKVFIRQVERVWPVAQYVDRD